MCDVCTALPAVVQAAQTPLQAYILWAQTQMVKYGVMGVAK